MGHAAGMGTGSGCGLQLRAQLPESTSSSRCGRALLAQHDDRGERRLATPGSQNYLIYSAREVRSGARAAPGA